MLCFPTQIKVGTLYVKDHQVLRLEHRLGLMEILKKPKKIYFCLQKLPKKKIYKFFFLAKKKYIRGHLISRI